MNILYIASSGVLGGATKSFLEMVTTIQSLNEDVKITVCTSEYNEINSLLKEHNINSIIDGHMGAMEVTPALPNKYRLLRRYIKRSFVFYKSEIDAVKRIESQVDVKSFDIIHSNTARDDIGCLLARKYGIPHVMHIREFGKDDFNCWFLRRNYCNFLNSYVDTFIAISNSVRVNWIKRGLDKDKIQVIYNGVDSCRISKTNEAFSNDNKLRLVIAGGVCEPKGQHQIIEAINILPLGIKSEVFLDIFGWGDENYMRKLNSRVEELGLEKQVRFMGPVEDMYSILQNYHIGLTCSKAEGFGRVTAEYMHARLGVIASDTGANKELIDDNINGLIYKYGDYQDLARKIKRFYEDRAFLKSCGNTAQKKAALRYTKEKNASDIIELYKQLLVSKGKSLTC